MKLLLISLLSTTVLASHLIPPLIRSGGIAQIQPEVQVHPESESLDAETLHIADLGAFLSSACYEIAPQPKNEPAMIAQAQQYIDQHSRFPSQFPDRPGLRVVAAHAGSNRDSVAVVAEFIHPRTQLVSLAFAYRGSVTLKNWQLNIRSSASDTGGIGTGFYLYFGDCRTFLTNLLKAWKVRRVKEAVGGVYFFGHSLGGTAAVLSANIAAYHGIPGTTIMTYGQPRVFTRDAVVRFKHFAHAFYYRFVASNDFVPDVPSASKYQHFGETYFLTKVRPGEPAYQIIKKDEQFVPAHDNSATISKKMQVGVKATHDIYHYLQAFLEYGTAHGIPTYVSETAIVGRENYMKNLEEGEQPHHHRRSVKPKSNHATRHLL